MEWIMNMSIDARAAYLLTLTEKAMEKIENEEGYHQARKAIDMCWDWVEDKKYSGDELYLIFDNEDDGGVSVYLEFTDDPQQETIWFSIGYAIAYTIWQAYQYENEEYVPQPIELVDDSTIGEFMKEIKNKWI
ncbi:MAG: Imm6 family immunity protein [Thermoactinomyces sp.]